MNFSKLFLSILTMCLLTGLSANAAARRPLYSDDYTHRFEVCGAYQEDYFYAIKEQNQRINLKTSESIIGIRGGKCATRSVIYVRDFPKPIGEIKCSFTAEQRKTLVERMKTAKNNLREEQYYRQTYVNYVQNPEICKIIDYIEND